MRLSEKETRFRDTLAELEDQAGGVLAGASATEMTVSDVNLGDAGHEADAILDEIGASSKYSAQIH